MPQTADPRIVTTLLVALAAYTMLVAGLWWLRYVVEVVERSRRRMSPALQESMP